MRWIFRLVGGLVSVLILVVAGLFLIPAERIAQLAAQQFEAATGRSLVITGSVRPSIFPVIGARIEGVRLANAPWAAAGEMLEAEAVELGLDLAALIRGDLVVRRFEAQGPRILVERGADGQVNWIFERLDGTAAPADTAPAGQQRVLSLERAVVSGADLRFVDHLAGTEWHFEGVDLELTMPAFDGPGTLTLAARRNGQAFDLEARLGTVAGLLAGEVTAVSARLTSGGATIGFEGRGGLDPLAAEGQLTLQAQALAPLLALAGAPGAEPLPAAARPLALSGQVTLAPAGSVHLRDASLSAGANRASLALDLTLDGPRPHLGGSIDAGALDLRPFLASEGTAGTGAAGGGWSRERIDASALDGFDATLTLSAGPVQTGVVDLTAFRGGLSIERSRGVLDLREVRLFDGVLRGELVANNRSGLSVGGTLTAQDLALLPLLRQFAGYERLSGTGAFDLRFLGVGNTMDAIMRSLSGEGRLSLGQGEIIGFDLAGMLRNLDMAYMGDGNRTIYQSVAGQFRMENGVLRNDDLRMDASRVVVEGRGTVDLGARTLDYRIIPSAFRDAEGTRTVRVPLMITGPWDAPRFRLDLEGLAEERLREERERLEERARDEARRLEAEARARAEAELQRRLGVQRQEGQSTEDAVRERFEEEVGRGLMRLLGGN